MGINFEMDGVVDGWEPAKCGNAIHIPLGATGFIQLSRGTLVKMLKALDGSGKAGGETEETES